LIAKFKPLKYEELRRTQRSCINYSVFYLGLFGAILFNYILTLYMGAFMAFASELGIRLFDKLGFEVHFVRLLYSTIFDVDLHERHHYPPLLSDPALVLDILALIAIILPLFVLSLRYLTHQVQEGPYRSRWNALLAPIAVVPCFFFRDWDILFLSVLVLLQNLWVTWRQVDGGDDEYTWMQYHRENNKGSWTAEKVAASTFETLSMMHDPMTAAAFGGLHR
jgi:hypothetical protein